MSRRLIPTLLLALLPALHVSGAEEKLQYYVQLIRGTKTDTPPGADAKAVGPKLSASLRRVFVWNHYWEMNRQEVALSTGQKKRMSLNKDREVEVEVSPKGQRIVTAFSSGKQVARSSRPVGEIMTVIGGERDEESAWFIIVRRDKPTD